MIRVRPLFVLLLATAALALGCGDDSPTKPKTPPGTVTPPVPAHLAAGVTVGTGTLTGSIYTLAVGDLSGDSIADLAVSGEGDQVWVGLGTHAGLQGGTVVHTKVHASALAICDFDHDGFGDLIAAGGHAVVMLRGSAGGIAANAETVLTFADTLFVSSGGLATGDFTNDGRDDILLASYSRVYVAFDFYLPKYLGTVIQFNGTTSIGSLVGSPQVADVNGDGTLDVAGYPLLSYGVQVYLGVGNGTFHSPLNKNTSGPPSGVALEDLDGDGDQDLVVEHSSGASGTGVLAWSGGLGAEELVTGSGTGSFLAAIDLNHDGKPDLVTGAYHATQISMFYGNGSGGLVVGDPVSTVDAIEQIAVGDLNGDRYTDVITRGSGAGTVRALYNQIPVYPATSRPIP